MRKGHVQKSLLVFSLWLCAGAYAQTSVPDTLDVFRVYGFRSPSANQGRPGEARWYDADSEAGRNYFAWRASYGLAGNVKMIWPTAAPTAGQALIAVSADSTTWGSPAASIVVREVDLSPSVSGVTTLEFQNSNGLVVTNPSANVARVDLSSVVSRLGQTIEASEITDSTLFANDIAANAAISLSQLATGTSAQIPVANSSGVLTFRTISGDATISNTGVITVADDSHSHSNYALNTVTLTAGAGMTGGGDISANRSFDVVSASDDIVVNANNIQFVPGNVALTELGGTLSLAKGGTNADLSATGGSNQFVKQSSAGAALSVGAIGDADVPNTITLDNLTQVTTRAHSDLQGLTTGDPHTQYALRATTLTAGDGLAGGGDLSSNRAFAVNLDFDGGIESIDDSLNINLDGSTLAKSASGLKISDSGVTTTQVSDGTLTEDDVNANIAGSGLVLTPGSPGALDWAPSELGNITFGNGGASTATWTLSLSGATDPALSFGNNLLNVTNAQLQEGGADVFTTADGALADDNLGNNNIDDLGDVTIASAAAGHVLVRNAGNTAFVNVAMSGDATIATNGAVTVADDSHAHTTTTISGLDASNDFSAGQVPIARGGTGTGTAPSDGKLLIGKTDNTYAVANLSAGSNISVTNGDGTITIAATGVGEVNTASNLGTGLPVYNSKSGVTLRFNSFATADFDSASNTLSIKDSKWAKDSELHNAVTLATDADVLLGLSTQQLTLDAQTANTVFAGATSGGAADPTFRALVDADIPDNITITNLSGTNSGDVTLAGTPDYITRSGQVLTLNDVDLGAETAGNYVASVATTSPLTGGATGSEGATLTLAIATNGINATHIDETVAYNFSSASNQVRALLLHADSLKFANNGGIKAVDDTLYFFKSDGTVQFKLLLSDAPSNTEVLKISNGNVASWQIDAGGEANTASNLGGGLSNYDSKSGVDLRFNTFAAADFDLASNVISIDDSKWAKDSELHAAVTLAGENYLSISTQQIIANSINLASSNVTGVLPDANVSNDLTLGTVSGAIDAGSATSLKLPNGAAPTVDAFGKIAGDNNQWATGRGALVTYDGTAATALLGVLTSDNPSAGEVPKFNSDGTITWESDNTGGTPAWSGLSAPTSATSFVSDGTSETFTIDFQAAFTTGSQFVLKQSTGNPTGGILADIQTADADVTPFRLTAQGTSNGVQMNASGVLAPIGTGQINANRFNGSSGALTDDDLSNNSIDDLSDVTITSASAAHLLVRNAGNSAWVNVAMSGDGSISATGALTLATDALLLNEIGDAGADATIANGAFETDITSTIDAADKAVLTLTNTDADAANDNSLLDLRHNDGADANVFYLRMVGDNDGTPTNDFLFSQAGFTSLLPVNVPAEAYDATGWNGDTGAPRKDDVRDELELKLYSSTAASTYAPLASPTFTGTVSMPTPFNLGGVSVLPTGTELNFVDGVTSAIQTQIDGKQASDADLTDLADGSLTGTKVGFADTDNNFTATDVQSAIEELDDVINGGLPNAATGKVDWSELVNVPAGFADGSDADAATAWDAIADAAGNGSVGFGDTEQIIVSSQTSGDVAALTLDINQVDDAAATDDLIAFTIDGTSESGDAGDTFTLMRLLYENGTANTVLDRALLIDNAETTASTMTDAILITSSGVDGGVVDAIDASATNITNALNIGANNIVTNATTISSAELDRLDGLSNTIVTNATAVTDVDGAGLVISSGILAVGAGAAITVNANDIAVTADGIGPTQLDETANYAFSGALTATGSLQFDGDALRILDAGADHYLTITPGTNLTANRVLTITTGDAARTLNFAGDATISGTNSGDQTITLSGDITGSGTSGITATIANDAVTNAKAANMAQNTIKMRVATGSGDAEDIDISTGLSLVTAASGDYLIIEDATDGGLKRVDAADFLAGGGSWSSLTAPSGAVSMVSDGTSETATFDFQAAFTTGNQYTIKQTTGNPTGGSLFAVQAADADVSPIAKIENTAAVTIPIGLQIAATNASGVLTTALDLSDAEIVTALALGSNDVTVGGVTISSAEFAVLDGAIDLSGAEATGTLAAGRFPALTGDVTTSAGSLSAAIGADKITEAMLKAVDTAVDEDILTYESTTGDFEWHTPSDLSLVQTSRTITIAGTTNEITSSTGAQDLSANRTWTLSLPATIDLGGKTSFEVPNSGTPTVDAVGEVAVDDNAWATSRGTLVIYDGTAETRAVNVLSSDTPSNGQVPTWNTGGTITWETPSGGGGDITDVGPGYSTGAAFTDGAASTGTTMLIWEGTTVNTSELSIISPSSDPGSDINITLPSATGNVLMRTATLTNGGILLGTGTDEARSLGVAANGEIPIGDGTTDPVLATITGTSSEITVTNGAGSITLSLPDVYGEIEFPAGVFNPAAGDLTGATPLASDADNTNDFTIDEIEFSASADNYISATVSMPPDWDGTTSPKFKVVSYSTGSHASNTAAFDIATGWIRPGTDSWVAALGSAVEVTQTYTSTNVWQLSSALAPTPGGTAASGAQLKIRFFRQGTDATNDTFASTTRFVKIVMQYKKTIYGNTTSW